jgi:type II secretory pathway component PulF
MSIVPPNPLIVLRTSGVCHVLLLMMMIPTVRMVYSSCCCCSILGQCSQTTLLISRSFHIFPSTFGIIIIIIITTILLLILWLIRRRSICSW